MSETISTAMSSDTKKRSAGSVKTKKEMSIPHCGSVTPNDSPLSHRSTSSQRAAAARPANTPSTAGSATITSLRSGSIASRYWSSVACSGVDGAYTGRLRNARFRLSPTTAAMMTKATAKSAALVPHCVQSTFEKPSWSNHSTSVQKLAARSTRATMAASTAAVTPSGLTFRRSPLARRTGRGGLAKDTGFYLWSGTVPSGPTYGTPVRFHRSGPVLRS